MILEQNSNEQISELSKVYGPLIGGEDLSKVLGFRTSAAFRRAERKKMLGLKTFTIKGRRGKFAYTKDVAVWLASLENENSA